MPEEPNEKILGAPPGACQVHSRTDMAERLKQIEKVKDGCGSSIIRPYVLLSTIYAAAETWEKAGEIRVALSNTGSRKEPGNSVVIL